MCWILEAWDYEILKLQQDAGGSPAPSWHRRRSEIDMEKKKSGMDTPSPASDKKKALETAIAQIEKNFGKGTGNAPGGQARDAGGRHSHRFPGGWTRRWASAACPRGGSSRSTVLNPLENHPRPPYCGAGTKARRRSGLCGRRARLGSRLCRGNRRGHRQHARLPARYRRAGAGNHRRAGCAPAPWTVVVVDSVAALTPRQEIEGEMGDTTLR